MAIHAPAWVLLVVLATILICQVTQTGARSYHPPHTVFGPRSYDIEGFERDIRKVPPFALFGRRPDGRMAFIDDMDREERKVPPFAVFNRPAKSDSFDRDARVVPPFAVFGNKGRGEGKRSEDEFPEA